MATIRTAPVKANCVVVPQIPSGRANKKANPTATPPAQAVEPELRADADLDWLSGSTLASLQGGLMLTQAQRDPRQLHQALDGSTRPD